MSEWQETEIGNIPIDWELFPIGEIGNVTKLAGFEYTKHITYVEDGEIIALRALNVRDGKLDLSDVKRIYRDVSEGLERSKLLKNDILFTYVGANIGQFALVPENNKFHLAPNICRIRCAEHCYPYFLFSYFRSEYFKESLDGFSHGSSQPTMPMGSIRQIPIPIPPLDEQRAIASILSSLDDKIDLLHRQNQTLEKMAETLFRQWFLPTGRHDVEDADENWEEGIISDYAEHSKVSIKPSADPLSVYAHFSIPGFDAGKEPIYELGQEIRSSKYQVFDNSILFSKLNPHKDKRVWMILNEVPENAICSTEFQVLKPFDKNHLYFVYGWLSNYYNYREISSGVGGTSGSHQRISPSEIFSFPVPKVSEEVLQDYSDTVKPLFQKQKTNQKQIRTLTALRDMLLPKLMNGKVRVKETEKVG